MDSIYIYVLIFILLIITGFLVNSNTKLKNEKNNFLNLHKDEITEKQIENLNISKNRDIDLNTIVSNLKFQHLNEINNLKDQQRENLQKEYDQGLQKGLTLSHIEIQMRPFKNVKKEGNLLNKKEITEVGCQYQIFSNGFPCFEPHKIIIDSYQTKELNEKGVELIATKIDDLISKIPSANLIVTESISGFAKSLLNPKNKKLNTDTKIDINPKD